eukprot:SAG31_NODE_24486_length_480_cov_1.078740_1_plen_116_part_10
MPFGHIIIAGVSVVLNAIARPSCNCWGCVEHISRAELAERFPPRARALEAVQRWATEAGATVRTVGTGDVAVLQVSIYHSISEDLRISQNIFRISEHLRTSRLKSRISRIVAQKRE